MNDMAEIDDKPLRQLFDLGGIELAREMVDLFDKHFREMIAKAAQSCRVGDNGRLAEAMHSLKSSLGNVGAAEMAAVAQTIELNAKLGVVAEIPRLLTSLEEALPLIMNRLEELMDKLRTS